MFVPFLVLFASGNSNTVLKSASKATAALNGLPCLLLKPLRTPVFPFAAGRSPGCRSAPPCRRTASCPCRTWGRRSPMPCDQRFYRKRAVRWLSCGCSPRCRAGKPRAVSCLFLSPPVPTPSARSFPHRRCPCLSRWNTGQALSPSARATSSRAPCIRAGAGSPSRPAVSIAASRVLSVCSGFGRVMPELIVQPFIDSVSPSFQSGSTVSSLSSP